MTVRLRELATYSFTCNVGRVDRAVRVVGGIAMVLVGILAFDGLGLRIATGITGVAIVLTGMVSRCGIYYLLGTSTRSADG